MKFTMKFTVENQKDNRISRTTTQSIKHVLYRNNEVTISGMNGKHSVWHNQGHRMSQKIDGLSILEAVDFANELINNI